MPFEDNTFDYVYSIESTCHSPDRRDIYREIYRVLKPGGKYITYEWCLTDRCPNPNPTLLSNPNPTRGASPTAASRHALFAGGVARVRDGERGRSGRGRTSKAE